MFGVFPSVWQIGDGKKAHRRGGGGGGVGGLKECAGIQEGRPCRAQSPMGRSGRSAGERGAAHTSKRLMKSAKASGLWRGAFRNS